MAAAAPGEAVLWANYALISSAVLYIYDCILTFPAEVRLVQAKIIEGRQWDRIQFVPLRYFALLYHVAVLSGVSLSPRLLTPKRFYIPFRCSNFTRLTIALSSPAAAPWTTWY
ncbi:hypothetical protein C8R45DRAFT_121171 [Mycena sanguinolenta]|nr:hypothetical protein C8R45DRAFT_121171 [Mycena sanguinolenta]